MTPNGVHLRSALATDSAAPLLYESAKPYYDAYAGSQARAVRMLEAVYPRRAHSASFDVCTIAEDEDGRVVGVLAAFPAAYADRLARRFVSLTAVQVPPWRWPAVIRHLRASGRVSPQPPADAYYVDALAVVTGARRQGIATALLEEAERQARHAQASLLALDTGLSNDGARALYEARGFTETGERRAPNARIARAVGGPGFVSFEKAVQPMRAPRS